MALVERQILLQSGKHEIQHVIRLKFHFNERGRVRKCSHVEEFSPDKRKARGRSPTSPNQTLWFEVMVAFSWNDAVDQHWAVIENSSLGLQLTVGPAPLLHGAPAFFSSGHSSESPRGSKVTLQDIWAMTQLAVKWQIQSVALPTKERDATFLYSQDKRLRLGLQIRNCAGFHFQLQRLSELGVTSYIYSITFTE